MAMALRTPEGSTPSTSSPAVAPASSHSSKPPRVLACTLCHQRKVKCDRKFPCSNCIRSRAECVPATAVRPRRRRRVTERDLLERLGRCEKLLRRHNIEFEPLSKDASAEIPHPSIETGDASDDDRQSEGVWTGPPSPSTSSATEKLDKMVQYEANNFWRALNQRFPHDDDSEANASVDHVGEIGVKKAWDQVGGNNIFLVLGSRKTATPLAMLHPEPVQIFQLWQVFLDNVNPLVKVVHGPSLQARIVAGVGDLGHIDPVLEALLFSIYCMSVRSLSVEDCQALFAAAKDDLLARHDFGCQQALMNCGFLRTNDRECLTALYIYILSIGPNADPVSISSMLGIVVRIARRLGIHSEAASARHSPFEAEMRRRLWWSLVLFDTRMGEMADYKSVSLDPNWDCKIPLNVNDSDLRPDMKQAPVAQPGHATDAIFAAVRGEFGDFVRRSNFHLDFTNMRGPKPTPQKGDPAAAAAPGETEFAVLERMIEEKYLRYCDPEIPLHFMTLWTMRGHLAKLRLVEQYSRFSGAGRLQRPQPPPPPQQQQQQHLDAQLDAEISHAFRMLECDTRITTSPLTRGYQWMAHYHFQFPAYLHIVHHLRRRPLSKHAPRAWDLMSANFEARFAVVDTPSAVSDCNPLFRLFAMTLLPAWKAREAALAGSGSGSADPSSPPSPPRIVILIRERLAAVSAQASSLGIGTSEEIGGQRGGVFDGMDFSTEVSQDLGVNNLLSAMGLGGEQFTNSNITLGSGELPRLSSDGSLNLDMNQGSWASMDWEVGVGYGGW